MRHDRERGYDDEDGNGRSRTNRPYPKKRKQHLLLILVFGGLGLIALGIAACCGGYFLFGLDRSTEPAKTQATLDSMGDMQLPVGFNPYETTEQITGVVSVEFRSRSGRSHLKFTTASTIPLKYPHTIRESRELGRESAGGNREKPTSEQVIKSNVRAQPAEYLIQRFGSTEAVKGFFQGKKFPVQIEGELDVLEFPPGTAATFVQTIR